MDINNLVSLIPLISIIGTIGLGIFTWYTRRGNDRADAASVLTGSALSLVLALEKRIDDVEEDLKEERTARLALQNRATAQDATIAELRLTVEKQAERIDTLEKENVTLKDENHKLRNGKGGKEGL